MTKYSKCEMKMPLLMYDSKQKLYGNNNSKMMMPYCDYNMTGAIPHKSELITIPSSKIPFSRDYKASKRDKYTAAYNHPPPLATQQAIAMMEYELGNKLIISNSNGHCKPKPTSAVEKRRYVSARLSCCSLNSVSRLSIDRF